MDGISAFSEKLIEVTIDPLPGQSHLFVIRRPPNAGLRA